MFSGSGMPDDAELDELLGEKTKDNIIEKANSSKFLSRLTPEMVEKLEKIDVLEKHCLELEEENAKLTSQLQEIEKSLAMSATPTHAPTARKAAVRPSTGTMKNQPQFANPYLQNGYQDW